jgi:NodT family efflux transporter outer membrane factor (OMF) lipoprotein
MKRVRKFYGLYILLICLVYTSCKIPKELQVINNKVTPSSFVDSKDTVNSAQINWREFFVDKNLVSLIDTAIKNNPDVLMTLQEIEVARNRVMFKDALLSPSISAGGGLGLEKVGRYTSQGAGDASAQIIPGKLVPEHLTDFLIGFHASWEVDIWGKIRSSKKAAFTRYLGSIEGKNFVITNSVAEVANSYYELLSLDNLLEISREAIQLQKSQLEIVKVQKEASVVTELAVKQFEARVFNSQGLEFELLQKITENENKINFLLGRFSQKIIRDKVSFSTQMPAKIKVGIPSQLLVNRPDIKQAELELLATKCDARAARLEFYPSLDITSSMGFQAFKPSYLLRTPQSLLYSLVSDLAGPIVNRKAITAEFNTANALQVEALYNYQKTILNGFAEVSNELSNIYNLEKIYNLKSKEVDVLITSIDISNDLFKSARANYLEVLMAQRDALESKLELAEAKKRQFNSIINIYKALGGGWK